MHGALPAMRVLQLTNGNAACVRLTLALERAEGIVVIGAVLDELLQAASGHSPDAVIIDFDMECDVAQRLQCLAALREVRTDLPVLACGSRNSAGEIAASFGTLIDDFVFRPFDTEEVVVRISNLERNVTPSSGTVLHNGDLEFDLATRAVVDGGKVIDLTVRERGVLQVLLCHKGETIPQSVLAARLSTIDEEISPQSIRTYIHSLRRKLTTTGAAIRTIRGTGYMLAPTAHNKVAHSR